jgi:hypothetical protein
MRPALISLSLARQLSAILSAACWLAAWAVPASAGGFVVDADVPDCRQPAPYYGVSIHARQVSWHGGHLVATFVLTNVSGEPVLVNGPGADVLIMTELELISPDGPRYYADWRTTSGVFRRVGYPPLEPNASAESRIEFEAQHRPYLLHFHRIVTTPYDHFFTRERTKIRRSTFICSIGY